jgi:hypothetical protein
MLCRGVSIQKCTIIEQGWPQGKSQDPQVNKWRETLEKLQTMRAVLYARPRKRGKSKARVSSVRAGIE